MSENKIPQSEITRVKGLGFLWDKRTADRFNGRVITRNGKITAEECAVVAEAAKKFGSGEIAMTTRLTMEIQGVPFENIEPLRQYLKEQAGLETGGTARIWLRKGSPRAARAARCARWSPVRVPPASTASLTPTLCPKRSMSVSLWATIR